LAETPQDGTLPSFLKDIKTIYALLAGAIPLLPSGLSEPGHLLPPLGDLTDTTRYFVVIVAACVVFVSFWFTKPTRILKYFATLMLCGIVSYLLYMLAFTYFVVRIDRPANGSTSYVSVGFTKTQDAVRRFNHSEGDVEMIENTGLADSDVATIWTKPSLFIARACLLLSYLGAVLSLALVFSSGVRYLTGKLPAS
jgi:hypothetical protein